jgi:hypothetical protein
MSFNSGGVYTPASGATTAAPGQVIQSAVWNSIFTDLSSALTLLGQQLYGTTPLTAATYTPVAADSFILVNYAGAVTISLPAISARGGYPLAIKDISGVAQTNNITINPNGSDTIESLTTLVIKSAWGGYTLYPTTSGWVTRP